MRRKPPNKFHYSQAARNAIMCLAHSGISFDYFFDTGAWREKPEGATSKPIFIYEQGGTGTCDDGYWFLYIQGMFDEDIGPFKTPAAASAWMRCEWNLHKGI